MFLACLPPVAAGFLLLRRVAPAWAAFGGLVTGLAVLPAFRPSPAALGAALAGAIPLAAEVLLILYGGIILFAVLRSTGLHQVLGQGVASLAPDRPRRVLLVALGVAPFLESVIGFGVGMIMAAPILREFGLSSRLAALVAMLGMVSVPWGAWAPGTLVASELAGVDFDALGAASARLMLPAFLACGFAALAAVEGARGALRRAADVALAAAGLWMGIWGANLLVGTAPAGAVGSAAAAGTVVALANWGPRGRPSAAGCAAGSAAGVPPGADAPSRIAFGRALVPYAVLLGTLLAARLVVGITGLPDPAGRWLRSPALWLPVTAAITLCTGLRSGRRAAAAEAALWAFHRWKGAAAATLLFLCLGILMTHAGMANALAAGAARIGGAYVLLAPWLGGLGGFLTGTNTGANAMFAAAQAAAAVELGVPVLGMVAFQNAAASLLTMVSGPRVALARTLVDEGESRQDLVRLPLAADLATLAAWSLLAGLTLRPPL